MPQRSSRRIARIGEYLAAGRFLCGIQRQKILPVHIKLAAHFQNIRQYGRPAGGQGSRNGTDTANIGGDILALGAVAAGGGLCQAARFIAQRQRQAVDFRLGDKGQRIILRQ